VLFISFQIASEESQEPYNDVYEEKAELQT